MLGVFLREPLVDWQREAGRFRQEGGETGQQRDDRYIQLKVPHPAPRPAPSALL